MQTQVPCPNCHGEGTIIKHKCKECNGEGIVKGDEVVEINIPAGVEDGMCVTVRGKGNAGKHNGINPYTSGQVEKIRTELKELLDIIDRKDAEGMKTYLNKIRNNVKRDIDLLK